MYVCIVTDIDECSAGIHKCSHTCENTDGGLTCSCPTGMMLDNDNRTCVSKYGWTMITGPVSVVWLDSDDKTCVSKYNWTMITRPVSVNITGQ